jgi:hypothetical protein
MIYSLHDKLSNAALKYHELGAVKDETIVLIAKSLDAEGIFEVMLIKEMADMFDLTTKWDGQNIQIEK